MPEICRFLGIVISMYFDEHNPPHFHVRYNEYRAVLSIQTLNVMDGHFPLACEVWSSNGASCTAQN
jgi:hypothetical protein